MREGIEYSRKTGLGKFRYIALCMPASDWRGLNRNQKQTAILETKGSDLVTKYIEPLFSNESEAKNSFTFVELFARHWRSEFRL